jgi:hypothetical protein
MPFLRIYKFKQGEFENLIGFALSWRFVGSDSGGLGTQMRRI